jgi:sarcosine oxidase subunit alpha
MEWAIGKTKPFVVGKRAIDMQVAKGVARRLVGFALLDQSARPKECHLVIRAGSIAGRVTSATHSPSLGRVIGLAYVPTDMSAPRNHFAIRVDKGDAEVVSTPFFDPENARQEM